MKKHGIKIAFTLIEISLSACNGTPTTTNNQKLEEHEEHHEEGGNLTTFTQVQIQTVNIRLGHIEEKALAATFKTNGTLSMPVNHQAKVSAVYAGIIKNVKVEMGSYVQKGQVIATISNPDFL